MNYKIDLTYLIFVLFDRLRKLTMACATEVICLLVLLFVSLSPPSMEMELVPSPVEWPHQFHSVLFITRSNSLQKVDLWYDWPNGLKYDLEWNNGTSFIYTLEPFNKTCKVLHFDVGILRPNWLQGATYLGQQRVDNFLCNVWDKVDFILYYEDVLTHRPVKWIFYTGMTAHVMTFEVGAVLEDAKWQAPVYCFGEAETEIKVRKSSPLLEPHVHGGSPGTLMRRTVHAADAM